jgi:hypothetical protein
MLRIRARSLLLLTAAATLAACGDDDPVEPDLPEPASLTITAGNGQTAATNTAVAVAPTVRVLDQDDAPIEGLTVTFAIANGGGAVTNSTPETNATGHASVGSWTLGALGGPNTLTASVAGLPAVTFNATGQGPTATPANVTLYVGSGQTAQAGAPLPVSPTVRVTDAGGQPVQFANVTFTVQGGGGSITGGVQTTDADGLARVAAWRLGPTAGLNTLRATVAGLPPVDVAATARALDAAAFNVTLRFVSIVTPDQYAVFEDARERWEEVITGELTNIPVTNQLLCTGAPTATETIDDVVIFVNLVAIDGPGQVLASAGPCAVRTSNGLPIAGVMNFDTDDLGASPELFRDVILHEMGHVLGIGSLWNLDSPVRTLLTGGGGDDPFFTGVGAVAAFDAAGGNVYAGNKVPVENTGGQGTRDSHWRETATGGAGGLANELMTGFVSSTGPNPLSAITIASLQDMGYAVNMAAADAYIWSSSTLRLHAGEDLRPIREAPLTSPILVFDDGGRVNGSIQRR